mmetsp:Transcript_14954/g.56791  ORF Transcript_14954/g.56791 Transcript_14954/m.56791 type:complete len:228 (-) Transcript_14954:795-1478(-)
MRSVQHCPSGRTGGAASAPAASTPGPSIEALSRLRPTKISLSRHEIGSRAGRDCRCPSAMPVAPSASCVSVRSLRSAALSHSATLTSPFCVLSVRPPCTDVMVRGSQMASTSTGSSPMDRKDGRRRTGAFFRVCLPPFRVAGRSSGLMHAFVCCSSSTKAMSRTATCTVPIPIALISVSLGSFCNTTTLMMSTLRLQCFSSISSSSPSGVPVCRIGQAASPLGLLLV